LLQVTERKKRDAVMSELSRSLAGRIKASLRYPEGTVGALMDPSVPIFAHDATVDQALRHVREWHRTDISHVFLRGGEGLFHGTVRIAALVKATGKTELASVAERKVVPISNRATLESVAQDSDWDDYPVRPVVGMRRRLLGGLSRGVLRRSMSRLGTARAQLDPSALVANVLTVYLHSCRNLVGFVAQLPDANNRRAGRGTGHGRKR
jgi:Mg/Co/Ni transporter MgtE